MHPDYKMGLAVGLALVGLVGAMFFRRDPQTEAEAPPLLEHVEEIDEEVSDSPRAPYLNVIDDVSDQGITPAGGTPHVARRPAKDPQTALDQAEEQATQSVSQIREPGPEVDPLRAPRRPAAVDEPFPAHNREWQPRPAREANTAAPPRELAKGATVQPAAGNRAGGQTHTIEPGDTLSRIAERYLGSPRYYREIYQANRDKLQSVDDLPAGVTLTIPEVAGAVRKPPGPAPRGSAAVESPRTRLIEEEDSDAGEDPLRAGRTGSDNESKPFKLQFEPVRRGPFGTSRRADPAPDRGRVPANEPPARLLGIEEDESDSEPEEDEQDPPLARQRRSR